MAGAVSRRTFLQSAIGGSHGDDGPVLVVVFLRGGADTLNMLVPYGDDAYYRARPSIAIAPPATTRAAGRAIRLDDFYGLHPELGPLDGAYREGRFGFVQGVGSDNTSGSHFEAQDQMERGEGGGKRASGGWIGRFLRHVTPGAPSPLTAVAIGEVVPESLRGAAGSSVVRTVDEVRLDAGSGDAGRVLRALSSLYDERAAGVLGRPARETLRLLERVDDLKRGFGAEASAYPDEPFAAGLREIARLVKAGVGLRVACIDLDGWDTHFVQGGATGLQSAEIARLAGGLAAFDRDLAGYRDRVTTLVMTEFGRRIYENSSEGTDHGRGFAMMALGGRVRGGAVHGAWPGLDVEEGPLGPGGLRVLVDYRSAVAEAVACVGGLADSSRVFPGLRAERVGLFG